MKKKHSHTVKSSRTCISCGETLKLGLVEKNSEMKECFQCQYKRKHGMTRKAKVRANRIKRTEGWKPQNEMLGGSGFNGIATKRGR